MSSGLLSSQLTVIIYSAFGFITPVLGIGFIKIIAKNISNVKANKTLNNKSVKGSVFNLLPEYAIS